MLDTSHEGMDNVKRRVLEYLAVKKLNDNVSIPSCFSLELYLAEWSYLVLCWSTGNWKNFCGKSYC